MINFFSLEEQVSIHVQVASKQKFKLSWCTFPFFLFHLQTMNAHILRRPIFLNGGSTDNRTQVPMLGSDLPKAEERITRLSVCI